MQHASADYAFMDNAANEMNEKKDTANGKERQKRGGSRRERDVVYVLCSTGDDGVYDE